MDEDMALLRDTDLKTSDQSRVPHRHRKKCHLVTETQSSEMNSSSEKKHQ